MVEIVAFTGTFTDTGKDREAGVFDGDVANQFHQGYGLAHTGAAEQADLSAL